MSDIPNHAGFRLMGILKNGGGVALLTIQRYAMTGCHYLVDDSGNPRSTNEFSTWVPETAVPTPTTYL